MDRGELDEGPKPGQKLFGEAEVLQCLGKICHFHSPKTYDEHGKIHGPCLKGLESEAVEELEASAEIAYGCDQARNLISTIQDPNRCLHPTKMNRKNSIQLQVT